MESYEKAKRESLNLIVNPFYSDEALLHFQQWLDQAAEQSEESSIADLKFSEAKEKV